MAESREVTREHGAKRAKHAADLENAVIRLFGGGHGGRVATPIEQDMAQRNRQQEERNKGDGKPESLHEGGGGIAARTGAPELGHEGAGVANRGDDKADEEPAQDAAGERRLNGFVRIARQKNAVGELVDGVGAHGQHKRQDEPKRGEDVTLRLSREYGCHK